MSKINVEQELNELIFRFKRLKKALAEEGEQLSPAQRAAAEVVRAMGKIPSKETLLKKTRENADQQRAQHLANQMVARGMLGRRLQPTNEDMQMWARNNGFQTEEELQKTEANWGNNINNWLAEATKPLNARFKSEEEERAYWDKIKVADSGRGNEGY